MHWPAGRPRKRRHLMIERDVDPGQARPGQAGRRRPQRRNGQWQRTFLRNRVALALSLFFSFIIYYSSCPTTYLRLHACQWAMAIACLLQRPTNGVASDLLSRREICPDDGDALLPFNPLLIRGGRRWDLVSLGRHCSFIRPFIDVSCVCVFFLFLFFSMIPVLYTAATSI